MLDEKIEKQKERDVIRTKIDSVISILDEIDEIKDSAKEAIKEIERQHQIPVKTLRKVVSILRKSNKHEYEFEQMQISELLRKLY